MSCLIGNGGFFSRARGARDDVGIEMCAKMDSFMTRCYGKLETDDNGPYLISVFMHLLTRGARNCNQGQIGGFMSSRILDHVS